MLEYSKSKKVVQEIDLWPMHSKLPCIISGGLIFLKKVVDEGNAMTTFFLEVVKFFKSTRPFHGYKLLRDVANTQNPLALYVFIMAKLAFFNKNGAKILVQLFKTHPKKSIMIPCRNSFIKMLNNKASKIIPRTVLCHKKEESQWNDNLSIDGENEMYVKCLKCCVS